MVYKPVALRSSRIMDRWPNGDFSFFPFTHLHLPMRSVVLCQNGTSRRTTRLYRNPFASLETGKEACGTGTRFRFFVPPFLSYRFRHGGEKGRWALWWDGVPVEAWETFLIGAFGSCRMLDVEFFFLSTVCFFDSSLAFNTLICLRQRRHLR